MDPDTDQIIITDGSESLLPEIEHCDGVLIWTIPGLDPKLLTEQMELLSGKIIHGHITDVALVMGHHLVGPNKQIISNFPDVSEFKASIRSVFNTMGPETQIHLVLDQDPTWTHPDSMNILWTTLRSTAAYEPRIHLVESIAWARQDIGVFELANILLDRKPRCQSCTRNAPTLGRLPVCVVCHAHPPQPGKLESPGAHSPGWIPRLEGNIMNLTPIPLSDHIKSLLSFGLKFCPTPADNKHTTMVLNQKLPDFALAAKREFYFRSKKEQRLRRNPHLANNPRRDEEERERTGFKLPSDFCPADHQIADPVIRALESIETSLTEPLLEPLTHNITEAQQEALRQLTFNRDNIIIRKADKGSATVLQTRTNYMREIHRQLDNPEYYIPTETNHTPGTIEALSAAYTQLAGIRGEIGKFSPTGYCGLSKQQIEYFSPWTHRELRDRIAYGLPKIHKAPAKWPIPYRSPPSRPIISSCGCVTSEISELVDYILNPIAVTYDGYIKNTQHFVDIVCSLDVPQDATLLTSDVNGMYTNLPVRGILAATRQALADHPPTPERPPHTRRAAPGHHGNLPGAQ